MDAAAPLASAVGRWHDFYLLTGTAAATLMGLLFVGLSLHLDEIAGEGRAHIKVIARDAFASFLIVLFVSLLMLAPALRPRPLDTALLGLGVVRVLQIAFGLRRSLADGGRGREFSRGYVVARVLMPLFGGATMALAGATLLRGNAEDGLAELMLACVLLIGDATRCAWDLMVRVGRMLRHPGAGAGPRR